MNRRLALLVFLLSATVSAGCGQIQAIAPPAPTPGPTLQEASGPGAAYWPTNGWRVSSPEEQGMDAGLLAAAAREIEAQGLDVHSLLVVRNGYLVAENYYPPYDEAKPHVLYSVTKSVVSTLVGIAKDEGRLPSLDARVLELFPNRSFVADGGKRSMTLENVLTMTTGLDWPESDATFSQMYRSRDWLGFVLDLPMAARPGGTFRYCSGCSHVLSEAVTRATGVNAYDYARGKLLGPLGIAKPEWERAPDGVPIGGWGLYLTSRDMAKLGYLFLNDGVWDGKQVVSAGWVQAATAKHVTADDGFGYGYQWWRHDRLDAFFARGRAGQLIFVVPGKQLVVVITANQMDDRPLLKLIEEYVVAGAK